MNNPIDWLRSQGLTAGHKLHTSGLNELNGQKFYLSGGLAVRIIMDGAKLLGFLPLNLDIREGPDANLETVSLKCTVYFSKEVAASIRTRMQLATTHEALFQGFEPHHFYLSGIVRVSDKGYNLSMTDTANEMLPLISIMPGKADKAFSFGDLATREGMKSVSNLIRDSHILAYKGKKVATLVFDKGIGPYHLFNENFETPEEFAEWALAKLEHQSITVLSSKGRHTVAIPQFNRTNRLPVIRAVYRLYELMGGHTFKFPTWNGTQFTESPWAPTVSVPELSEEFTDTFTEAFEPEIGEQL